MTVLSSDQLKLYPQSFGVKAYKFNMNQHKNYFCYFFFLLLWPFPIQIKFYFINVQRQIWRSEKYAMEN